MKLSYIMLDRILAKHAQTDAVIRRRLNRNGKVLLSDGRALSDEALQARLAALEIPIDRAKLDAMTRRYFSAQDLSRDLVDESKLEFKGHEEDWIWIALTCLWERWFPDRPSMEMIDDRMQAGYQALEESDAKACEIWIDTWKAILSAMDRLRISRLADFDEIFAGTNSLLNWSQDFELRLGNAALDDPKFWRERIAYCRTVIERSQGWELEMHNFKRAISESLFSLGEPKKAEYLFELWLQDEPHYGWGWISWADCYWGRAGELADPERAESILKKGLAVANVENREDILDRLASLYEETERPKQAVKLRREIKQLRKPKATLETEAFDDTLRVKHVFDFGEEGLPVEDLPLLGDFLRSVNAGPTPKPARTRRNDPCPCGSGKKFKKCCGK